MFPKLYGSNSIFDVLMTSVPTRTVFCTTRQLFSIMSCCIDLRVLSVDFFAAENKPLSRLRRGAGREASVRLAETVSVSSVEAARELQVAAVGSLLWLVHSHPASNSCRDQLVCFSGGSVAQLPWASSILQRCSTSPAEGAGVFFSLLFVWLNCSNGPCLSILWKWQGLHNPSPVATKL